jgi:transcriptional regulator with GAF, ATPase, and Fis domain
VWGALNKSDWKIRGAGGAAELLGVKPTTLISRIKKNGLKRENTQRPL